MYAKVLLVGDWAQLGAIEAGGAFHMLANDRTDAPTLTEVHRFTETWEAAASLQFRNGDTAAIDAYLDHGRVHSGERDQLLHQLVEAWHSDTQHGLDSIMIAPGDASVRELNAIAQAHRRDTGNARPGDIELADGHTVGVGDTVVTRYNDRRLTITNQWVKNGDTWTVTATHTDGSITVSSPQDRTIRLPADYTREHVELGYAATIHRAQGRTVDTAHALIDDTATRESAYVAATRARAGNHLYLATEATSEVDNLPPDDKTGDETDRLARIIERAAETAAAHAYLRSQTDPFELRRADTVDTVETVAAPRQWANPGPPSRRLGL
jgi:ATP-dependent exoDNAse (exonuclease V) alpha subunit